MKNNKLLYLLTIFITLFTFNINVNAAQELTCVYKAGFNNKRLILTQDEDGTRKVYNHKKDDAKIEDKDWEIKDFKIDINEVNYEFRDENDDLLACPQYTTQLGVFDTVAYFGSDFQILYNKGTSLQGEPTELEDEYLELKKIGPKLVEGTAKELTCIYKFSLDASDELEPAKKIALYQFSTGEKQVYFNYQNLDINQGGWEKQEHYKLDFNIDAENLTECPNKAHLRKLEKKIYFDYESGYYKGYIDIEDKHDGIHLPTQTESVTNSSTDNGLKCSEKDKLEINTFNSNLYHASCIYARDINDSCHIIQIDIEKSGNIHVEQSRVGGANDKFVIKNNILNANYIKNSLNGWCPNEIYVAINKDQLAGEDTVTVSLNAENNDYNLFPKVIGNGKNLVDDKLDQSNQRVDIGDLELIGDLKGNLECDDLFEGENGKKLKDLLKTIVTLVKIAIPVLLIAFGIMDFTKAVFAGKEDDMKKAQGKFIKRAAIGVCIFLIPSIMKFLLVIANSIWGSISADLCGIL